MIVIPATLIIYSEIMGIKKEITKIIKKRIEGKDSKKEKKETKEKEDDEE